MLFENTYDAEISPAPGINIVVIELYCNKQ